MSNRSYCIEAGAAAKHPRESIAQHANGPAAPGEVLDPRQAAPRHRREVGQSGRGAAQYR